MKFLIVLTGFIAVVSSAPDDSSIYNTTDGLVRAGLDDILYHFYSKSNPWNSVKVRHKTIALLSQSAFTSTKDTLFIIHGWKNDNVSEVNLQIRQTILQQFDLNVFVVDWSILAGRRYTKAQGAVVKVGQFIADFIRNLKSFYNININMVKCVGHSLGAHICGNIGASLGGRIDRITGLDPAGPLFRVRNIHNRLDPTDARTVHVIHTNDGLLGFSGVLGHADFYPNGGKSQPGCGIDLTGSCAHSRAYFYYAESLTPSRFTAYRCKSYRDFSKGRCNNGGTTIMGKFYIDTDARGQYFLDTNPRSPFARS